MAIVLNTLPPNTTILILDDELAAAEVPVHPATLLLDTDYGFTADQVLSSEVIPPAITAGRIELLIDGETIDPGDFGPGGASHPPLTLAVGSDPALTLVGQELNLTLSGSVGVESVNGDSGPTVLLDTDDIPEGTTNEYFTETRVDNTPSVLANTAKVSADGSVTTHSDITDAGSGQIITTAERTDIGLNTASRHDAVSLAPGVAPELTLVGQELDLDLDNYIENGDNISLLTNDANYVPSGGNISEFTNDSNYVASGDNVSLLTNDAGYLTSAPVDSVNGETGTVVLDTDEVGEGSVNLYFTETRVDNTPSVVANTAKISADGSVTTHSDITDAGSGAIITAAERSALHNAVTLAVGSDPALSLSGQELDLDLSSFSGNITTEDEGGVIDSATTVFDFVGGGVTVTQTAPGEVEVNIPMVGAPVTSVNTQTGAVVLDTDDINEGTTNLYYTETRVSNNVDVVANTAKVSADGSVTTHSDVSDAGSGQIITTAERSELHTAVTLGVGNDPALVLSGQELTLTLSGNVGVESVNGDSGPTVSLDTDDIPEGTTNEYFTETKVDNTPSVLANTAKVSADGSVTTHSDVTDAGSGQIITTAERADLSANTASRHDPVTLGGGSDPALALVGQELTLTLTPAPVDSVNGQTGTVVLDTDDIAEGTTNLYYTETRVSNNTDVVANTAKVSADGSVTTHSDVTDAGSGAIITAAERSALHDAVTLGTGNSASLSLAGQELTLNENTLADAIGGVQPEWIFKNVTSQSDPGVNNFRVNNTTPASVTQLYINDTAISGVDSSAILNSLDPGDRIYIEQLNDKTKFYLFNVVSVTDQTGWFTIDVTVDSSSTVIDPDAAVGWDFNFGAGDGSDVDLSIANITDTTLDIANTGGTDATVPAATSTTAGLLTAVAQTIGGRKTFNDDRIIIDSPTASATFEIGFFDDLAPADPNSFGMRRTDGGGVFSWMNNANFPQLFLGDPNGTGSAFIDATNNRPLNLNVLDTGVDDPGTVTVGIGGFVVAGSSLITGVNPMEVSYGNPGTLGFVVEADGTITAGSTASYEGLVIDANDIPNKAYIDALELGDLSDVDTTGATTGDQLRFDGVNWARDDSIQVDVNGCSLLTTDDTGLDWCNYQVGGAGSAFTVLKKSNGTIGTPTALVDGDKIGGWGFIADDGNGATSSYVGAEISAFALGTQDGTNGGTRMLFQVTPETTKSTTTFLETTSDGSPQFNLDVDVVGAYYIQDGIPIMDAVTLNAQGADLTINYNTTAVAGITATFSNVDDAPIHGTQLFTTTTTTITTNYTGKVELIAQVPHTSTGARASLEGWIEQNTVKVSPKGSSYIRNSSGDNEDYLTCSVIRTCAPGDVFRVQLKRETGATNGSAINMNDRPTFSAKRIA